MAHDVFLQSKCACGEIGIRARLRIWCRETCRFESYQAHCFSTTPLLTMIKRGVLFFIPVGAGDCTRNRVRLSTDDTKYAVAPKRKSRRNESLRSTFRKNKRTFSRNSSTLPTNLWTFSFYSPCFSPFCVRTRAPQPFPRITFTLHPTRQRINHHHIAVNRKQIFFSSPRLSYFLMLLHYFLTPHDEHESGDRKG